MDINSFKKTIFNGRQDKQYLISTIKQKCNSIDELIKFDKLFDKELKVFKGLYEKLLYGGKNLPKHYNELDRNVTPNFSFSIEKEINWQVLGFIKNSKIIQEFLVLKDRFNHNLLIGNYSEARSVISLIESTVCISYWSIENRLILDELEHGSEGNWKTRNLLLDETNHSNVRAFSDFFSYKAESKVSFFQYNEYFKKWEDFQSKSKYGLSNDFRNFIRFKSNYFSLSSYDNFEFLIYSESGASLIDRYLFLIKVLQHLLEKRESSLKEYLIKIISALSNIINDSCLLNMLFFLKPIEEINKKGQFFLDLLDRYTSGDYDYFIVNSRDILLTNCNFLEFALLYSKSLIELERNYEEITENDSLVNTLSKAFYNILIKTEDCDAYFVELIKYAYTFNNSYIGMLLYSFVKDQLGWSTIIDYTFQSRINSHFINPILLESLVDKRESNYFLENLNNLLPNSITVKTFEHIYSLESEIPVDANVPSTKAMLYQARKLLNARSYQKSLSLFNVLLTEFPMSAIVEYEVLSGIYTSNLSLGNVNECLISFVDSFLKNPQLTRKMDTESLLKRILEEKFKGKSLDKNLIDFPIFFKINCEDKIRIKQSYELFLKEQGCIKPSELNTILEEFNKEKMVYFLKSVCSPETLQLSRYFNSSYDVNEERIKICQILAEFDSINSAIYNEEIAIITQKNSISKVIGKIDEGKIYVNEEKIRQLLLKPESKSDVSKLNTPNSDKYLTKEFFYRTVDLRKFAENNEFKVNKIFVADFDEEGQLTIKGNPAFDDFKKIFLEIRDYFVVSNEFGLDAYLSTRIRHGTLPNHIRSVFERLNLVTAQSDGVYTENEFWNEKLNLNSSKKDRLQSMLAEFSKEIDSISSYLKEELIQCKTEKRQDKPNALFNYSYTTDLDLITLYIKVNRYEDFIELCINELWKRTELCLDIIRKKLNEDIKMRFIDLITNLEASLETLNSNSEIYELKYNVNFSRTEIQILLNNIEKWFQRANSSFEGDYELSMIGETSIQITKNINPSYNFDITTDILSGTKIYGEYHHHFIDILRNFLENMIKRSSLSGDKLQPLMKIKKSEEFIVLNFQNNVSESINIDILSERLEIIKQNWLKLDNNVSKEEGTGFSKIKKILQSDLGRVKSDFQYEINERRLSLNLTFETNGLII